MPPPGHPGTDSIRRIGAPGRGGSIRHGRATHRSLDAERRAMSRTIHLTMDEGEAMSRCAAQNVGVSAVERLPLGGVRLVCMSVDGAEQIRHKLKAKLMKGDAAREQHGPGWGFVPRS